MVRRAGGERCEGVRGRGRAAPWHLDRVEREFGDLSAEGGARALHLEPPPPSPPSESAPRSRARCRRLDYSSAALTKEEVQLRIRTPRRGRPRQAASHRPSPATLRRRASPYTSPRGAHHVSPAADDERDMPSVGESGGIGDAAPPPALAIQPPAAISAAAAPAPRAAAAAASSDAAEADPRRAITSTASRASVRGRASRASPARGAPPRAPPFPSANDSSSASLRALRRAAPPR